MATSILRAVSVTERRLDGRRCLVTGGSRGLGRAIGEAFAGEGARVAFTYQTDDRDAESAREAITAAGQEPRVFKGSVADAAHVRRTVAELTAAWGGVDVLVNNAGITQVLPIALIDEEDWDEVMAVNVKGAFLYSRAVLKGMIRARFGRIITVGNFASERVVDAPVHYAASKSALRGFTEALAREVDRDAVTCNLLAPGLLTEGLATMLPSHRLDDYLAQCPAGRLGTPAELAEVAVFLASDDASLVTAAKLACDGGL